MTLGELKHQHPLQYQRLLDSGELEQHLVEPPSAKFVGFSTVLGFTLIIIGLTLLTLVGIGRSEEHTSELQSLMRISYAVFCLKKKNKQNELDKNKTKIM